MTLNEYKAFMLDYFSLCKGQSVLEIGPHEGIHTKLIAQQQPKYLELIEPYERTATYCRSLPGVDNLISDDVFFVLKDNHPMDVVVCCGVLYHLHSPLYLLELIVNNCNPKHIVLDCVEDQQNIQFLIEEDNIIGNRQLIGDWRSAGFNLVAPFEIIEQAMKNMGYSLIKKYKFGLEMEFKNKSNFWVAVWEQQ